MKKRLLLVSVVLACAAIVNIEAVAESPVHNVKYTNPGKLPNQGFMKNPPAELKKKFPMCDEFLNVEWINKEKKIGYSEFDIYSHGKCGYVNSFKSFVYLEPYRFTYNLIAYEIDDKTNTVTDSYKETLKNIPCHPYINARQRLVKDNFDTVLKIMKESSADNYPLPFGEKTGSVIQQFVHHLDQGGYSLSGFQQNVCIVYPDESKAWLAEIKNMRHTFDKKEIDKRFEEVGSIVYPTYYEKAPEMAREAFEFMPVIDINNDGIKDYFSNASTLYFRDGAYRPLIYKRTPPLGCGGKYSFVYGTQLTTDGKDFYYYDCNLTQLFSIKANKE